MTPCTTRLFFCFYIYICPTIFRIRFCSFVQRWPDSPHNPNNQSFSHSSLFFDSLNPPPANQYFSFHLSFPCYFRLPLSLFSIYITSNSNTLPKTSPSSHCRTCQYHRTPLAFVIPATVSCKANIFISSSVLLSTSFSHHTSLLSLLFLFFSELPFHFLSNTKFRFQRKSLV